AGPMRMATTTGEGAYLLEKLPPGNWVVTFMDSSTLGAGKGMSFKMRQVTIANEEQKHLDVAFGTGHAVSGTVYGLPPGPMRMVTLRRPGGKAPEELDPMDIDAQFEAARYQGGVAFVGTDGHFEIKDVEPGTYIIEVPAMPEDPTDLEAYTKMDRTPRFRKEIEVGKSDVTIDISIR